MPHNLIASFRKRVNTKLKACFGNKKNFSPEYRSDLMEVDST